MILLEKIRKITPPVYLFACLILAVAIYLFWPQFDLIPFSYRLFSFPFIILGVALNIWTDNIFKDLGTTVEPLERSTNLVVQGPFSFTRHPMYLGAILILIGTAIALGNLLSFLSPLMMFLLLHYIFIPYEEENLIKDFGQEYLNYKEKTSTWF